MTKAEKIAYFNKKAQSKNESGKTATSKAEKIAYFNKKAGRDDVVIVPYNVSAVSGGADNGGAAKSASDLFVNKNLLEKYGKTANTPASVKYTDTLEKDKSDSKTTQANKNTNETVTEIKAYKPNIIDEAKDDLYNLIFGGSKRRGILSGSKIEEEVKKRQALPQYTDAYSPEQLERLAKYRLKEQEKYGVTDTNALYDRLKENTVTNKNTDLLNRLEEQQYSWGSSPVKAGLWNVGAGVANIGGDIASAVNGLGIGKIPGIKEITNAAIQGADWFEQKAARYNKGLSGQNLGVITQGVVQMLPYVILGTEKAAEKAALNAPKYAEVVSKVFKNPSFWYSLTTQWGGKYQEALDNGANEKLAFANATNYALPAALVEVVGGVGSEGSSEKSFIRTVLEEIGEELIQDVISGISDKSTTKPNLPIYSSSADAIVNPKDMAQTAFTTAAITAIGAGGSRALQKGVNRLAGNNENNGVGTKKEEASHRKATASNLDTTPTTSENVPYTKSSSANNIPQNENAVNLDDMQNGKIDVSKVNLSIDKNFISNYDAWVLENRPDRRVITVGRTSDALKSIGVKEQKITWDTSKINKALKKHSYLDDNIIKQIPSIIENPITVMQSKSIGSRITMFGEVYDNDGLPIMAVLELEPKGRNASLILDEIKLVSAHSRKDVKNPSSISQTQNIINSSEILYVDPNKERTDNWLTLNRLQLPLSVTNYGPIKSITYSNEDVNNYNMQNAENNAIANELNFARENASGIEVNENDSRKMKLAKKVMRALNERYGVNFKIYSGESLNGFYHNGTVYINEKSEKPILSVIGHEFLHGFKDIDAEGYALLKSVTESDLRLSDYERYKQNLLSDWKEAGIDISALSEPELKNAILEEAMSDMMGEIINDPETIRKIALEDKNLAERIMVYLKEFIEQIRTLFDENDAEIQSIFHNYEQVKAVYQEVVAQSNGRVDGDTNLSDITYLSTSSKNLANDSNTEYNEDTESDNIYFEVDPYIFLGNNVSQLKNVIMQKQAPYYANKERLPDIDYSYTSDCFVMWKNHSIGNYTLLTAIPIENNSELTTYLERSVENGDISSAKGPREWFDSIRDRERSDTGNNDSVETTTAYGSDDRFSNEQSSSNTVGHTQGNTSNTEYNKIEDGDKPSSFNASDVKLSVKKSSQLSTSSKNLANNKKKGYNEYWKTDLTKSQLKIVEGWIRQTDSSEAMRITDTANWYKGRLDGEDLFVIYSTENSNNPTILYEVKGGKASSELNILMDLLEGIENGEGNIEKSRIADEILSINWMQEKHNMANSDDGLGKRGSNTGDASVLQRESSQLVGSKAFRNVIRNLFEKQERDGRISGENNYSNASNTEYNKIEDGDKPSSFNASDVKLSVRKGSRAEKAQRAMQNYEDSGNVADLPTRQWAKEYYKAAINTEKMLENQIATKEWEKRYAKTPEQIKRLDEVLAELRRKQEENVANVRISGELIGRIEGSIERNYNLADIIDDLKDTDNGLKIKSGNYRFNDFYRNFERVFGKHFDKIKPLLDRFDDAKGNESKYRIGKLTEQYDYIVKQLGIKKGSKESKAVQWIAEGERNPDAKNKDDIEALKKMGITDIKNLDPSIRVPYTEAMLRAEFGEAADNILKAEQWYRKQYDEMINAINATQRRIYPNRPEKLLPKRKDYMRHFREVKTGLGGLLDLIKADVQIAPGLVSVSEHTSPKEKWASFKQERKGKATSEGAIEGFNEYIGQASYAIYINPYIEQFRGLARDLAELKSAGAVTGTDENGKSIKRQTDNSDLNGFIEYLNDYANDLAGKTGGLDRALIKSMGASGRTVIKALQWFNNRTKANAVLGNVASMSKQVMNIPNGMAYLKNPANILTGIWKTFEGVAFYGAGWIEEHTEGTKVGKKIVEPISNKYKGTKMGKRGLTIEDAYKKSSFLTSRYSDKAFSKFEKKSLNKGAAFMLGFFDELGTRAVWNALYYEAVKNDEADPIRYADVNTRKAVAGRGIGEIPLAYKSQLAKLALPFQIEPTNSWNVMRDMISGNTPKGKLPNFANIPFKTAVFFGVTCAMNAALEALTGSKGSFDPLGDMIEGLMQGWKEEEEENVLTKLGTGTKRASQNVAGDFIGSRSFGWVVGELLDTIDEDWATNYFNDSLYQSQGVNIPAIQSATKAFKKAHDKDWLGAAAEGVSSFALPFGGKQLDKTFRGIGDVARGGNYQSNIYKEWSTGERGDMYYPIEKTTGNYIKAGVFGPSSLKANNEYWENKKLEGYEMAEKAKAEEKAAEEFFKAYKKENPNSEVVRLYNEIKRKDIFPFEPVESTGSYTHKKVKTEYTLTDEDRAKYQKLQNEKMQKKYNEVFKSTEYKYADAQMKRILLEDARSEAKSEVKEQIKKDHRNGVIK